MTWVQRLGGREAITAGIVAEFRALSARPHGSGREEAQGAYLLGRLERMGLTPQRDGAGNVTALVPATPGREHRPRLILQGHMDMVCAVRPGSGFDPVRDAPVPVVEGGFLRSDGRSSLGADNNLGNAAVLWLLEQGVPHGPLRLLFTVAEERGLEGSAMISREFLQPFRIAAAFIFDIEGEVGRAASSAPGKAYIHLSFHGKSAHAGFEPEKGRSALLAAAAAALAIPSGRIDADTTANIGSIRSGGSINVVPDLAEMEAEARSSSMEKLEALMGEIISKAETAAARHGNTVESECRILYRPYSIDADALSMRLARESSAMIGRDFSASPTSGGSDANSLQALGIDAIVLSAGYIAPHSVFERIMKKELQALKEQIDALCSLA